MKRLLTTLAAAMLACGAGYAQKTISIKSPDGLIRMTVRVDRKSLPEYDVFYRGTQLVNGGRMGFVFDSGEFGRGLRTGRIERRSGVERYDLITGKSSHVEEPYTEAVIPLLEEAAPHRRIDLVVRTFNDGAAFRYVFPEQEGWSSYVMHDELTTFDPAGNPKVLTMYLAPYTTSH